MNENPFQSPTSDFQNLEVTASAEDQEIRKNNMTREILTRLVGCFYLISGAFGILGVVVIIDGYLDPYNTGNKQYAIPIAGVVALISILMILLGVGLLCLNRISYYIAIPVFISLPFISWLLFPAIATWIISIVVVSLTSYLLLRSTKYLYSDEYRRIIKGTKIKNEKISAKRFLMLLIVGAILTAGFIFLIWPRG